MKAVVLLVLMALILAGCSSAPESKALNQTFSMSSEKGGFFVRGRLHGNYAYDGNQIVVTVEGGTILSTFSDLDGLQLRPKIAGPGTKNARLVAEGASLDIGNFGKGVPRELTQAMQFSIPLPRDFDPSSQWLVFEFVQTNREFSVICDARNLNKSNASISDVRLHGFCWANPLP